MFCVYLCLRLDAIAIVAPRLCVHTLATKLPINNFRFSVRCIWLFYFGSAFYFLLFTVANTVGKKANKQFVCDRDRAHIFVRNHKAGNAVSLLFVNRLLYLHFNITKQKRVAILIIGCYIKKIEFFFNCCVLSIFDITWKLLIAIFMFIFTFIRHFNVRWTLLHTNTRTHTQV